MAASDYKIAKLQALDEAEWTRFREEYHDRVFGYLKRQVGDIDLAEDLTQDTFLGAVRGIKGFDARYNVEQYLMGIARNKGIDQLRKKKVEVHVTDKEDDSSGFFNATPSPDDRRPSQIHAARETVTRQKDILVDCLRDMVQEMRDRREWKKLMTIELCFLKDWKHRAIAEKLGIKDEKSIAGIKFRAIRDLQQRLMQRDPRRTLFRGFGGRRESVKECPELKDLAHFVETGEGTSDLQAHLKRCDACQEARTNLEDESMSLQISISELWFREQVSCPDAPTLDRFRKNGLGAEEQAYVEFHLETLECRTCQARMGEAEVSQSPASRGRADRSRRKVADATSRLIGDLRKGKGR